MSPKVSTGCRSRRRVGRGTVLIVPPPPHTDPRAEGRKNAAAWKLINEEYKHHFKTSGILIFFAINI